MDGWKKKSKSELFTIKSNVDPRISKWIGCNPSNCTQLFIMIKIIVHLNCPFCLKVFNLPEGPPVLPVRRSHHSSQRSDGGVVEVEALAVVAEDA